MRTASAADRFDIRAVENALAELWVTKDPSEPNSETVRACAVNFVIPIKPGSYNRWQNQIAELSRLVPSRILVIEEAHAGSTPAIHAQVNASCHRRKDGSRICSEVVHMAAVPDACMRLPSICRALAVSDLPLVYLAVDPDTLAIKELQTLREPCDLVIVDSDRVDPNDRADDMVLCDGDLVWPRLVPWRSAVGHFLRSFREFPADQVRAVRVSGTATAAILMASWICDLLKWDTSSSVAESASIVTPSGRNVAFDLQTADAGCCGIKEVELDLASGERDRILFAFDGNSGCCIRAQVGSHCIDTFKTIRLLSFAEEVAHIVHTDGADQNYANVMRFTRAVSG